jgi:predicted ester cyclase
MSEMDQPSRDVTDYIFGITKAIWEDREISSLTKYYGEDLIVRSPASIVKGNTGIIAATMATLAEFPDRQLFGEDVIWSGTGKGFLTSHRLICTATHTAPGVYGNPTGREISYRILADCFCSNGAVQDEWLVRDQSAIVSQLGCNVETWTRDLIKKEGGPDHCVKPFTPDLNISGPYLGAGNDNIWGQTLADNLTRLMSAEFSLISNAWDRAVETHYPRGIEGHGHRNVDHFWLGLRSCFPLANFSIHHTIGSENATMPPRAAVRWSLDGTHSGSGRFGTASGAPVHVMGITHVEFGPNGIRREWTLIDETAVYKQILLHTGLL